MDYLVEMRLAQSARPSTPVEGAAFVEQPVLPTLQVCKALEAEKTTVAGGPVSGAIALAMMVRVASIRELDELVEKFPLWPRMETTVTPLTTFDGRVLAVRSTLERVKAKLGSG
ncbi:MAG: muconolactone Delta-isomerase family protein [Alphaproteobacteria bacterium]